MSPRITVDPDRVGLLVFDVDGTLSVTIKPVYITLQRAFAGLGTPFPFSEKDVEAQLGKPAPEFYAALTPHGCPLSWQEIRARVADEEPSAFSEYGTTYPGVFETLRLLRERNYKLALYSNSIPSYFNTVTEALRISDYFDYRECVGEYNLTKSQLVRKIMSSFGDPGTAVIGDRIHDIQAARENDALSVGCTYGYGGHEPEEADVTIRSFSELAAVFKKSC